jgi:hypothetical protein
METIKKPKIIKTADGKEYDVDVLTELSKNDPSINFKRDLLIEQHGGIEKFLKHIEKSSRKSQQS